MEENKLALQVDDRDNVATVFANDINNGTLVACRNKRGQLTSLRVIGDVPYGHKIAVSAIMPGEQIIKYGECIGAAVCPIQKGEYVHVHNIVALRGRGDLEG